MGSNDSDRRNVDGGRRGGCGDVNVCIVGDDSKAAEFELSFNDELNKKMIGRVGNKVVYNTKDHKLYGDDSWCSKTIVENLFRVDFKYDLNMFLHIKRVYKIETESFPEFH